MNTVRIAVLAVLASLVAGSAMAKMPIDGKAAWCTPDAVNTVVMYLNEVDEMRGQIVSGSRMGEVPGCAAKGAVIVSFGEDESPKKFDVRLAVDKKGEVVFFSILGQMWPPEPLREAKATDPATSDWVIPTE